MNYKRVFNTLGLLLFTEAVLMLLPLTVSFIYKEDNWLYFVIPIAACVLLGGLFNIRPAKRKTIKAKDGFVIVGLSWIFLSLIGALPFFLSKQIPSFIDSFFEIASGFTTTGASILEDVGVLSKSMLFWRSFSHWIGGMGVLVFIITFLPNSDGSNFFIIKAESPGPQVGKLVSKLKSTARILYVIYAGLTLIECGFLLLGGMTFFEAICNSFATAGTGGFSLETYDIANGAVAFNNHYCQVVIGVFMLLFGVNFNIYYLILIGKFKDALKSEELHVYLSIISLAITVITINLCLTVNRSVNFFITLKDVFFTVASIETTTGFAIADFSLWPTLSRTIIVILMFIGGCAGSTGGGLKVARMCLAFKSFKREAKRILHPNQVVTIKFEGHPVDDSTVNGVNIYFGFFIVIYIFTLIVLSFDRFDFLTNFTAITACLNNIGPGLGEVGPCGSYAGFSDVSKFFLIIDMLIGRLEIYPILVTLFPLTYIKK